MLSTLRNNSSYQVGAVFAFLILFGILFVTFWILLSDNDSLLKESGVAVEAEIRGLIALRRVGSDRSLLSEIERRSAEAERGFFYIARTGSAAEASGSLTRWPDHIGEDRQNGFYRIEIAHDESIKIPKTRFPFSNHYDVLAKVHRFDSGLELIVGRDVDDLEVAQVVASYFGYVLVVLLLAIFALSFGVAYYTASRFNRIATTTHRIIETGNLSERLTPDGDWDDLSRITKLLNTMLGEIELRVDGIKSVTDNIAHDLRTPLTRLRASIDREELSEEQKQRLLLELDGVLSLFSSLLRISAIEAGKQPMRREAVDLVQILRDAVDLYEPIAHPKRIEMVAKTNRERALGDKDLLFQVFANLIDNALKFSGPGGEVDCTVSSNADDILVTITDNGPGIPQEERSDVVTRFHRLDKSRSVQGNGLGLALVAAIVRRHGGTLKLDDAAPGSTPPGLCVSIRLPVYDPDDASLPQLNGGAADKV